MSAMKKPCLVPILSHRCAPGFYGNPMVVGSRCQPCRCNDNTDPNMLFTDCHPLTGECLSCMHNTAGLHCHVCAPGYYGDAIRAKNCTSESSFRPSSSSSSSSHLAAAVGALNTNLLSFSSSPKSSKSQFFYDQTCFFFVCFQFYPECNCSSCGTESCDPHTGQCRCKPGVTGPRCGQCQVKLTSTV